MVRDMMLEVKDLKFKMESVASTPATPSGAERARSSTASLKSSSSMEEQLESSNCFATCEQVKAAAANTILK